MHGSRARRCDGWRSYIVQFEWVPALRSNVPDDAEPVIGRIRAARWHRREDAAPRPGNESLVASLPQGVGKGKMPDQPLPTLTESAIRGLACKCPRCGKGKLYAGFLNLRPNCDACGLDYAFIDSGDGPAVFIIMLAGAIVVGCALIVEAKYRPPFWLHAVLWLPLILATTLLPLRAMKSLLIALQFHHKAAPGRLIDREPK